MLYVQREIEKMRDKDKAERIKKDIALFEESMVELDSLSLQTLVDQNASQYKDEKEVVDLAKRYYEDTKYYLEKGDYFTAFGCINYAHGLLDGVKKIKGV